MSRKIEFRFWDVTLNEMCYRKPLTFDFRYKDIIPLQFTGFKDCEGTKIYDGDILGDWTDCDGEMVQSNDLVYFDETLGSWMIDCSLNHDRSFSSSLFASLNDFKYKVIGNKYEKLH